MNHKNSKQNNSMTNCNLMAVAINSMKQDKCEITGALSAKFRAHGSIKYDDDDYDDDDDDDGWR